MSKNEVESYKEYTESILISEKTNMDILFWYRNNSNISTVHEDKNVIYLLSKGVKRAALWLPDLADLKEWKV